MRDWNRSYSQALLLNYIAIVVPDLNI